MVRYHKFDANFKVCCTFCKQTYNKLNSFWRHLSRKHKCEISELGNVDQEDNHNSKETPPDDEGRRIVLQKNVAEYLLTLKSSHNVNNAAIDIIVNVTKSFVTGIMEGVKNEVRSKLEENEINIDLDEICNLDGMFDDLSTTQMRKTYFTHHFGLLVII